MGGDAGVCKYVCFGGRLGKQGGRLRSVAGIIAVVPSSSEPSSSGDGERERGGTRMGKLGVRFKFFAAPFIFLDFFDLALVLTFRSSVMGRLNSSQASARSDAMAPDLLARFAYSWAR